MKRETLTTTSTSRYSMPIIRAIDALVGSMNCMRVDAFYAKDGGDIGCVTKRLVHPDLEDCVGQSTAAFGLELLREGESRLIPAGVYYPAELSSEARNNILNIAKENALVVEI